MLFNFRFIITLLIVFSFINFDVNACSSFQLESKNSLVGKSYDWRFGDGYIIFNPPELQKASLSLSSDAKKIQWTSQYSSITYNQYGSDFPNS